MEKKKENSAKTKKIIIISAVTVVAIIAVLIGYSAYLLTTYGGGNTIAKGITVDGMDIGGMTAEQAVDFISVEKEVLADNSLELVIHDSCTVATFREFEIDYNIEPTVEKAVKYGKTGNIFSRVIQCFNISRNSVQFKTEPVIDPERVSDYVLAYSQAANSIGDDPVIEHSYRIENDTLILTEGKAGTGIDKSVVAEEITDILKSGKSGTITVNHVPIDPAPWNVDAIYDDVCNAPTDAGYEVVDGKGYIRQARKGYKFNKADLEALLKTEPVNGEYVLPLEVTEPGDSKLDETGLFPEVISEYRSSLAGSSSNRRTNVAVACNSVNGTILNPDEVFSYNKTVGAVTTANGYLPATIFTSKGHESGIGGGICQLSSTLYCAALEGNLEIVKRRNHMYIVGYVPYGQDATVYEGELDFRFKNNTNEPMKITAQVVNGEVIVKLLGKKPDPDIKVVIENITIGRIAPGTTVREDPNLPAGTVTVEEMGTIGLIVDTYKNIYKNGELLSREYLHRSSYKPINRIEVHGTGEATETPSDTPVSGETTETPSGETTETPSEGTGTTTEEPSSGETTTPSTEEPSETTTGTGETAEIPEETPEASQPAESTTQENTSDNGL